MTYSLHEAKAKLSELVSLAESGETIEITRHGRVVAKLMGTNFEPRTPGTGRGTFRVIGDWELSDDEIGLFDDSLLSPPGQQESA